MVYTGYQAPAGSEGPRRTWAEKELELSFSAFSYSEKEVALEKHLTIKKLRQNIS